MVELIELYFNESCAGIPKIRLDSCGIQKKIVMIFGKSVFSLFFLLPRLFLFSAD